jgi:ADP-ribose pyrophosphatase YjhB (NUDIX family)
MNKIIIASGPVIVENNKVLLDKQGTDDFWKFCGGKIKEGETLSETAIRRSKEELGIEIELQETTPFILYTTKETPVDQPIDVILVHFMATRKNEIVPGNEVSEWNWFDINNLTENLAPNIKPVLKHFKFIK